MVRIFIRTVYIFFLAFSFLSSKDYYWQQSVNYEMSVVLIDSVRQLACSSIITYKNNSPDELNDLYFHLYPNAFQLGSVKSRDYLNGYGSDSRAVYFSDGLDGYESKIHIREFTVAKNQEIVLDDYKIDDTVLRAYLKTPLLPGEEVRIDIEWNHHVGGMVERAGYYEGQYNMAQWYPKIAAYDHKGWHAEPFHAQGEFYGEFGRFDVEFQVPEKFIVGASGVVKSGDPGWELVRVDTSADFEDWFEVFEDNYQEPDLTKNRKVRFVAENVHDFAWVASPNFLYEHDIYDGIDVHVLYNRINANDWNRVVRKRSVRALKWLNEKFGKYTYPQITNTDRLKSGGMEYPMLIMDGSDRESLIVHEIGHIWFYGILGNNEIDEAWIDEGFTTAQTRDYMMDRYGPIGFDWQSDDWSDSYQRKFWTFNNKLHKDQWRAIKYIVSGYDEPISRKSYLFKNSSSYRQNAYTKPSLMLNELKYILGDSLYYKSIQYFYDTWKQKHVNEEKFVESVEKITKRDLAWFFDPWLHDTRVLDYEISSWKNKKNEGGSYDISVDIKNLGNRHMPLLVETEFYDGTSDRRWWNNYDWNIKDTFLYSVPSKPKRVTLDPDVQTLDVDYRNNSTNLDYKIVFDWPGMNYEPRDKILYRWLPSLFYNEPDSYSPGLHFQRSYGNWEKQSFRFNYATKKNFADNKNNFYWYYSGSFKPVHSFKNLKLNLKAFNLPGLSETNVELEKIKYNDAYKKKPKQTYKIGVYHQFSIDTFRTNLYESGDISAFYIKNNIDYNYVSHSFELVSSISPSSDWGFTKISFMSDVKKSKTLRSENILRSIFGFTNSGFRGRFFLGKVWTASIAAPRQISFNPAGNSSSSMYEKSYLRGVDSFFGLNGFNAAYHLPSDGNIRALLNRDAIKTDVISSISAEVYFLNKKVNVDGFFEERIINSEIALFSDVGLFQAGGEMKSVASFGLGFRFSGKFFNKPLYLRVDCPLILIDGEEISNDKSLILSFHRSI
jgi:hypothetical protein